MLPAVGGTPGQTTPAFTCPTVTVPQSGSAMNQRPAQPGPQPLTMNPCRNLADLIGQSSRTTFRKGRTTSLCVRAPGNCCIAGMAGSQHSTDSGWKAHNHMSKCMPCSSASSGILISRKQSSSSQDRYCPVFLAMLAPCFQTHACSLTTRCTLCTQ